ncbi:hypothetical protein GCM10010260_80740 [Streptomyces filipinensis]|uniref:Uncharacterized protein n=1 Tax=Streptomyces filipinensis TaxID=66887 RepID=A0A918IJR6_9ACTN|nr:hypothetical protein [Streptomyces filipinensis]GGV28173.1 hypothetical protein GCM10010260_80740 [Streptomyces filipinensis]
MTDAEGTASVQQQIEASGQAQVTQVAGDYEEHHHQYVRGWQYLRSASVDDRELDLAEHAFVDPPEPQGSGQVAQAVGMLSRPYGKSHVLVLCGEAGTGRRTAALHALRKAGVPRKQISWLILDWDQPRTEQIPHAEGRACILDLTDYRDLSEDFYTGLADYQKQAQADDAVLVILADPNGWNPRILATVPAVHLARPSALKVAEAHLRHLAAGRMDWLTHDPLNDLLAPEAPASDGARLARLIAEAKDDDQSAVGKQFTDWQKHLETWFERHSAPGDLQERALLIAAALLDGAPAAVVLGAADQLFTQVGGELPRGGALFGRDLDKRLAAIDASYTDDEGISLEEKQRGLSAAALKYVWRQRPQLRPVLLEWASQISAPNKIAVRHLQRIADCLVPLALLPGGSTVLSVARRWIETDRVAHRQLAIHILQTMALHPVAGVAVRKQLYDWAQQKTTSEQLITAVAAVCAGELGQRYPRVALTRLRLLASRDDDQARDAVADAVRTLASAPEQRVLVLSEIVEWAESSDSTIRKAGAGTFLALTDITSDILLPLPASQESTGEAVDAPNVLADQLFVRGWRAALQEPTTAQAAYRHLAAWLDSPELQDDQVLPLVAQVLRGYLGQEGPSGLLVGSPDSSELGRARRAQLFARLISEVASPASPTAMPRSGGDGAAVTA